MASDEPRGHCFGRNDADARGRRRPMRSRERLVPTSPSIRRSPRRRKRARGARGDAAEVRARIRSPAGAHAYRGANRGGRGGMRVGIAQAIASARRRRRPGQLQQALPISSPVSWRLPFPRPPASPPAPCTRAEAGLSAGRDGCAAALPNIVDGVAGDEHGLHRDVGRCSRAMTSVRREESSQAVRERFARVAANAAAGDERELVAGHRDHAESGHPQAGIDAEYAPRRRRGPRRERRRRITPR